MLHVPFRPHAWDHQVPFSYQTSSSSSSWAVVDERRHHRLAQPWVLKCLYQASPHHPLATHKPVINSYNADVSVFLSHWQVLIWSSEFVTLFVALIVSEIAGKKLQLLLGTFKTDRHSLRNHIIKFSDKFDQNHDDWAEKCCRMPTLTVPPSEYRSLVWSVDPLECRGNYNATLNDMKLVHWTLMAGQLHLVQRG